MGKKFINPLKIIDIPIGEEYDGKFYPTFQITFDKIIEQIRKLNIPENEWDKIKCQAYTEYRDDPYLRFTYEVRKTEEELATETALEQAKIDKYNEGREQRKIEKAKQKAEKQKIIDSLTPEQKKALKIK